MDLEGSPPPSASAPVNKAELEKVSNASSLFLNGVSSLRIQMSYMYLWGIVETFQYMCAMYWLVRVSLMPATSELNPFIRNHQFNNIL